MKPVTSPYRCTRPHRSWIERYYQHQEYGRMLVLTIIGQGSCDVVFLSYHFKWMQWRNRVAREQAEKEKQQRRKGKGKGKGKRANRRSCATVAPNPGASTRATSDSSTMWCAPG